MKSDILYDEGSRYAIGREMLRLFVKQADHRAIPSHLFQEVMHLYDFRIDWKNHGRWESELHACSAMCIAL